MAILPILTAPDKRLKQKALPVDAVDASIRRLMDDMLETMYAAPGIGLAAPQIGVLKQVIVVDVSRSLEDERGEGERLPLLLANPTIVRAEGEMSWNEGCLSLPEHMAEVTRSAMVEVQALDKNGQEVSIEAWDLLAVCLQHEIDHLNGVLFIDHISRLKRSMIMQKLKKLKRQR